MNLLVKLGPIYNATLINATATSDSQVIDLGFCERIESVEFTASSVAGLASVKLDYAISIDGITFGAFGDYPSIITDSSLAVTPEGLTTYAMPAPLSRYIKFRVTGNTSPSNPADTIVTMYLPLRESIGRN